MKDIYEEYDDVFKDIVNCYLEDKNINNLTDDEIRIIANRLIYKNDTIWEYINECIYYEVQRIKDLRKKNKKEEER
jgi:hypothetical protein